MSRTPERTTQEAPFPSLRELVEFRERFGLEAYLIWVCAIVDMPRAVMLYYLKLGRHFGPLAQDRYERTAMAELIRFPLSPEALAKLITHAANGLYLSLDLVREIAKRFK